MDSAAPPRNLVVCIDGTSNQFGEKNTNVVELYSRLVKDDNQLTFYNSGIGTYAKPSWRSWTYWKQVADNKIDLAIAWNFEKIIFSAYRWLSENYRPKDRIFLFGFSRGAYQARAIAGMIEKVGLIEKGNEDQIPFAYELYANSSDNIVDDSDEPNVDSQDYMSWRFKTTFSRRRVRVHFVGVWDTVSSVGIFRDKTLPLTTTGMQHVCYFRHALALHERRVKFLPEYACGGTCTWQGEPLRVDAEAIPPSQIQGQIKEVWFAGSHSDVGGGSTENRELNKFRPAMRWISLQARLAGIKLKSDVPEPSTEVIVTPSMSLVWGAFEYLPFRRLSYGKLSGSGSSTQRLHLGKGRTVVEGQLIHRSSVDMIPLEVRLPRGWHRENIVHEMVEPDPFYEVSNILRDEPSNEEFIKSFHTINFNTDSVTLKLLSKLIFKKELLKNLPQDQQQKVLREVIPVLLDGKGSESQVQFLPARTCLSPLLVSSCAECVDLARRFLLQCTTAEELCLDGLKCRLLSVKFLPDNMHVVSGGEDGIVRIWDIKAGRQIVELKGHNDWTRSVAASKHQKYIASGSDDKTALIWSGETYQRIKELPHDSEVLAIAFSPDENWLVTGSKNGKVRLWNLDTEQVEGVVILCHTNRVNSVDVSSDGQYILSASTDCTVHLWSVHTQQEIKLHKGPIWLFASFSSDGQRVAFGIRGGNIVLWDWNQDKEVHLQNNKEDIPAIIGVEFSPDDRYIASIPQDIPKFQLWDVETKQEFGSEMPFLQHSAKVYSVAFSPNNKYIVSSCKNGTIKIWDMVAIEEYKKDKKEWNLTL
ncbi:WD40 repeat-like protein [Gymnopus androsaceus JB14]|uniref:WD40 repeat-like protein n=1 Tax=Gymnopus androsaceus JB14 TaxID=1447944 RepID=A0A6A4GKM3_9AGAR|nr:WD40 repeat-like protein [Gymnopus androsaceus JB14]